MAQLPVRAKHPEQGSSIFDTSDSTISVPSILTPTGSSSDDSRSIAASRLAGSTPSASEGPNTAQSLPTEQTSEHLGSWHIPDAAGFTFRCFHNTSPRPSQVFPAPPTQSSKPSLFNVAGNLTTNSLDPDYQQHRQQAASPSDKFIVLRDKDAPIPTSDRAVRRSLLPFTHHESYPNNSRASVGSSFRSLEPRLIPRTRERAVSDSALIPTENSPEPYDLRNERKPEQPFYAKKFQNALTDSIALSRETASIVSRTQASTNDSRLLPLTNLAESLACFEKIDTRTIAVLGDSGEGKSSLINSLLHYPEIARTGDLGSACTAVVTEYRQKTKSHTAPITIEVEHLSGSEIDDLITELVWNYSKPSLPSLQNEEISEKDYQRFERESEVAWSSLEAAFKDRREFNRNLLKYTSEKGIQEVTQKLIEWTKDLQWPTGDGDDHGLWKSTASTAEECCAKTDRFMHDRFWPFTKIIRIFLSAQILKAGVVLADLPGLQDTNQARVRVSQNYLSRSDHILLVAKITRAVTDASLKSNLYSVLKRHVPEEWEQSAGGSLNIAVVCTMSEDIDEANARKTFCGPGNRIETTVMMNVDKEIDRAKVVGDRKLKKRLQKKRKFLFVSARNAHVQEGLRKSYAEKVPGRELQVFCVSNTTYQKYTRKGNLDLVSASGIPDLRQFCYLVTADSQYREAKHFIEAKLGSLLSSMCIWATSGQGKASSRDVEANNLLSLRLKQMDSKISIAFKKSENLFIEAFAEDILQLTCEPSNTIQRHGFIADSEARSVKWQEYAETKGIEWTQWHISQYNAWCCNQGDHQTPGRSHVNWNRELIWKMRSELDYQWEILEDEIPRFFKDMRNAAETECEAIKIALEDSGIPAERRDGVDRRMQTIAYELSLEQQKFACEIKQCRQNTCEAHSTSYIVREMNPAYRYAAQQYDQIYLSRFAQRSGKTSRQINAVQGRIESDILFANIFINLQNDITRLVQKTRRRLRDKVLIIFALVEYDLILAIAEEGEDRRLDEAKAGMEDELRVLTEKYEKILADISADE